MPSEVTGEAETLKGLDAAEQKAFKALVRAIKDVSLDLSGRAADVTPYKEGHLEASVAGGGEVLVDGTKIMAVASAGRGASSAYAAYQHNTPGLKHKPGKIDHFLSTPLKQNKAKYVKMCQEAVAYALKGR